MLFRRVLSTCLALILGTLPALAETTRAEFTVKYGIIAAGKVIFTGEMKRKGYTVTGEMRSTGLLRAVARLSYEAEAEGRVNGAGFEPAKYIEDAQVGDRNSRVRLLWKNGAPVVANDTSEEKRRKYHVDPATQTDVLDPASAVFFLLRDVPQQEACPGSVFMFDGKRRSRLAVTNPRVENGALICDGEYRRIAGFPKWEMEKREVFPFSVKYLKNANSGLLEVREVVIDTVYGAVTLERE